MNLEKLFITQKELDERILDRFPKLRNEDLLDKKILALQVELGELAQNWRGFKFWSENQKPNTLSKKHVSIEGIKGKRVQFNNPLLEEYVDCLHFILSIGNDIGFVNRYESVAIKPYGKYTVTYIFTSMFYQVAMFDEKRGEIGYELMFNVFLSLGERLGFTWEQIEQAYYDKNKVNHERQSNGY